VTITSRYDGKITKIYYKVDETALVGKPLVDIETDSTPEEAAPEAVHLEDSVEKTPEKNQEFKINKVLATPSVRKMAMETKVDLADVTGSGKDGRILKDDIVRHLKEQQKPPAAPVTPERPAEPTLTETSSAPVPKVVVSMPPVVKLAADKLEAIKGIRKAMVKTMTQANTIPHFSYCDEYDLTDMVLLRREFKELGKKRGVSLSYMPFIIKACSVALQSYPVLNAHVDEKCENIIYKAAHNIGLAMDTKDGLLVPNIKNVESKSIFEIASELARLQQLGDNSKLSTAELTGGTFTISNIGSIGGTYMKPVILPPEVAIGAIGKIQLLPRYDANKQLVPRNIIQFSWSADHRVIDGATMARFSNLVKNYLEKPSTLLLELK